MDKIPDKFMTLDDAIEHCMRVMGWTRQQAEEELLVATECGELTAYEYDEKNTKH